MARKIRPRYGETANPSHVVKVKPGARLTIQEFVSVARGDGEGTFAKVELAGAWKSRCEESHTYVARAMTTALAKKASAGTLEQRDLIYGVLTGFGNFKDRPLRDQQEIEDLQSNILRSHSVGTGPPLPVEVVRGILLLRARTFAEGRSAVRPEVVQLLVDMLNRRVHPWVPEQGSVGASGDLSPLAHLSLVLIGEGFAWVDDAPNLTPRVPRHGAEGWDPRLETRPPPMPGERALNRAGLRPFHMLQAKEGLALTNGSTLSAALAALAVYDADVLLGTSNLCVALTLQALMGFTRALDPKVQRVRRHQGQVEAAAQITEFCEGSRLTNRAEATQDAYSLRCAPQVHGAVGSAIDHAWEILEEELNAVTDNPLFFVGEPPEFPEGVPVCDWDVYNAGNFHGQPVSVIADYLKSAISALGGISERRIQMLLDAPKHNRGLPSNLAPVRGGLNSGFMIAQYTAAALVSENKVLSHPSSVDSIPTSSNSEDYVSMAPIAARHARRIVANVTNIIGIELMTATQALDLRIDLLNASPPRSPGTPPHVPPLETISAHEALSRSALAVRKLVREGAPDLGLPGIPVIRDDVVMWGHIASAAGMVASGRALNVAKLAADRKH